MTSTHHSNLDPEFSHLNMINFAPKQYSPNLGKKITPVVPPKPKKNLASSTTSSSAVQGKGTIGTNLADVHSSYIAAPFTSNSSLSSASSTNSEASYETTPVASMNTLVTLEQPNIIINTSGAFATVLQPNINTNRYLESSSKNGAGGRTFKTVVDIPILSNGQPQPPPNYHHTQQSFGSHVMTATVKPVKPAPVSNEVGNLSFMNGGGNVAGPQQPVQQQPQQQHPKQQAQQLQQAQVSNSNYCNPSNYSNSSNYSNASNYSNMANYSGSSNYSNSSNYSDFSNYDHYNALESLTSYGGSYTPPQPEDELPPPPEPSSYTPSTNHNFPPPPSEEFPPPPSPVSSSYSELQRAANAQNYSTYGPISSQSSTYESIYEPILPRPGSQMSNRSAYSTESSLYGGYPNASRSKVAGSLANSSASHARSGDHNSGKEDEVDVLTNLLVQSMENSSDPDFFGICSKCGEKVAGEGTGCTAMNQVFHVKCFTCFVCQSHLQGKPFYAIDTKPYCEEDYLNTLEKCSVCTKPILDRILRATGKPYHPKCFMCIVCGKCLDGIPFTVDATNQIHCIEDFHKKFAPRCCVCKQPIMPELGQQETVRVVALYKSFHVSCYKCEDCGLVLSSEAEGRGCYPLDDHILCKSCNAKRVQFLTSRMGTEFN